MNYAPQAEEPLGPVSTWTRPTYAELNSKQKEIYNFQQVAALLADYGFNCIKLADDWQGADFLAYHYKGDRTLKVQLKGGLEIHKKYEGKGLYMAFRSKGSWYLIEHDALVELCGQYSTMLTTASWNANRWYYTSSPNKRVLEALEPFALGAISDLS